MHPSSRMRARWAGGIGSGRQRAASLLADAREMGLRLDAFRDSCDPKTPAEVGDGPDDGGAIGPIDGILHK